MAFVRRLLTTIRRRRVPRPSAGRGVFRFDSDQYERERRRAEGDEAR